MTRSHAAWVRWALASSLGMSVLVAAAQVRADEDPASLFHAGVQALHEAHPAEAIASLEALADRGQVDAAASYDRGLAYAMRVRMGAEVEGDLGRAVHGFEEARELARDAQLAEDASRALTTVRSEIARRRLRAGEPVQVDPGPSLARAAAGLLSEDTWSALCVLSSAVLAVGLFVRWLARGRRLRVSGGVAAGVAGPVLALAVVMTLASRHDRLSVYEAVVVTPHARPTDERGITVPGALAVPEGARVEVTENRGALAHVRFGAAEPWVPSSAVREIARRR